MLCVDKGDLEGNLEVELCYSFVSFKCALTKNNLVLTLAKGTQTNPLKIYGTYALWLQVSEDIIDELYEGLGAETADSQIRFSSLFVHALKPISVYEVEK
jgi:hypothetical protein